MIYDHVLACMGQTPVIRLNKMADPQGAEVLVKFEGLNVGGSIKTRTAFYMIDKAEKDGLIGPDSIIVEPTSGNPVSYTHLDVYKRQRQNPTVGLVNNGTEEGKGTTLTKAAYELLEKSHLNFIGSVEARQLPDGDCDVIVTDGFTGNAIIKLTEGMGLMVLREMKRR